jgi:hypothetical protein
MINRGKGMLIAGGLITKKKKIMGMSGRRDSGSQELAHETAILKRIRQWEAIDQDVY